MSDKLLSISIASYNVERFIAETVQSVLDDEGDLDRVEIIVVNDGSKDRTSDISHELQERYPGTVVVIDQPNGGYGSTINASLAIAKGKYYKLLDGDDWFNTDAIHGFLTFLARTEADLVITPYIEVRGGERLIDNHRELPAEATGFNGLSIDSKLFVMHEMAVRTDLLRRTGRSIAEHCFYTDSEFVFYCVSAAATVARYPQPIYRYRLDVAGQSVSLEGMRKHQGDLPIVADRIMSAYTDVKSAADGAKREILKLSVANITFHTYRAFMLLENPLRYRAALVKLDGEIMRRYPDCYQIGNGSKLVRLSRLLRFHGYGLLCRIAMRKFEKEAREG